VNAEKEKGKYFIGNLLSGGCAGAIGLTVVYPLDFARTRLGTDVGKAEKDRQFKGLADCTVQIFKSDGFAGLYRGFAISVVGIFVYRALYFGGYDSGKRWFFGDDKGQKESGFLKRFLFAQVIVSTSETVSFPLDTVRRRLMMQSGRHATGEAIAYNGTFDCISKVMKEEGINGFFKGNLSNIWRSIGSSLVLVLYDDIKMYFSGSGSRGH
jgi:solute carrier family 25 (adenine nucleotide translocator) protein 4/5/6/31